MAKAKSESTVVGELLTLNLYKPNQGRMVRQATAIGLALIVFFGAYTWSQGWLSGEAPALRIGMPVAVSLLGAWLIFRSINHPRFAEFLISVEGEMDKVSWASKQELYRATIVVIGLMLFLGVILYIYDLLWYQILHALRILGI